MAVSNGRPQQHDTRAWQSALDRALAAHGGERALARYDHLAHAFPSPEYDPRDEHHPHLNLDALKRWALYRGWRAQPDADPHKHGQHPADLLYPLVAPSRQVALTTASLA